MRLLAVALLVSLAGVAHPAWAGPFAPVFGHETVAVQRSESGPERWADMALRDGAADTPTPVRSATQAAARIAASEWLGRTTTLGAAQQHPSRSLGAPRCDPVGLSGFYGLDWSSGYQFGPANPQVAVGPDHVVEMIDDCVAVYNRQGIYLGGAASSRLFAAQVGGQVWPHYGIASQQIRYDRRTGRWFAAGLEYGADYYTSSNPTNALVLAVSSNSDPFSDWTKFVVNTKRAGFNSMVKIGLNEEGLYCGCVEEASTGTPLSRFGAIAIETLVGAASEGLTPSDWWWSADLFGPPCPADALGQPVPDTAMWIVCEGQSAGQLACIAAKRSGSSFWLVPWDWVAVYAASAANNTPTRDATHWAMSSANKRTITSAVFRGGTIWLTRTVGTDAAGGDSANDRCAAQWFNVDTRSGGPVLEQSGLVYDTATGTPTSYFFPSVTAPGSGSMLLTANSAGAGQYLSTIWTRRTVLDPPGGTQPVQYACPGLSAWDLPVSNLVRWGYATAAALDPGDDMTAWVVGEVASATANEWTTFLAPVAAPAPTITATTTRVARGATWAKIDLAGTGLYDPGVGFAKRLAIGIDGGSPNGITISRIVWSDPLFAYVLCDVAANADLGPRTVTVVNPDGQGAELKDALSVVVATDLAGYDYTGQRGQIITLKAKLMDQVLAKPIAGRTVRFRVDGNQVGTATTDATGMARLSYTVAPGLGDTAVVSAGVDDADYYQGASCTSKLTVNRNPTVLYAGAPVATAIGAPIRIYAYLRRSLDNLLLAGKTIKFWFNGQSAGQAVTGVGGYAEVYFVVPVGTKTGPATVDAKFAGDSATIAAAATTTATVLEGTPTSVSVWGAAAAIGQKVQLYASLWQTGDHTMLANRLLEWRLDGNLIGRARTDLSGYAFITYTVGTSDTPGDHSLEVRFAGEADLIPSAAMGTVTISGKYATGLYVAPRTAVKGLPVHLYAYLYRTADGAMLPLRTVQFRLNGQLVGSATTDGSGLAWLDYVVPMSTPPGNVYIMVQFAGDSTFDASMSTAVMTLEPREPVSWYVANPTAVHGSRTNLYCYLRGGLTNLPLPGKAVTFKLDGTTVGQATSDSSGLALVRYQVPNTALPGPHAISALFAGDTTHTPGSKDGTLTVK